MQEIALQGEVSPEEDPSYPKKQVAPDASVASLPSDREPYFVWDFEAVQSFDEQAAIEIISSPASPDSEGHPASPDGKHGFAKLFAAIDAPSPDSYLAAPTV